MANDFYNHGSFPTTGSAATSASMRTELDSIAAGFDKLPTLTGNANEVIVVNASGTALIPVATLPPGSGGTGIASYAVGDLVYADTTSTLAKLPDVATGNALISGGVGVAPSYGKIGLTTHITGTLLPANGGTGITSLGTGVATALGINVGTAGAFVVNGGALGTPSSGTLTNATGLPVGTGISGLGTNVATALAVNVGSSGAFVVNGGALGTPSSGTLTNATGLPVGTGISGLGTNVATALAVNVGTAGAFVVNGGALGTPSSGTLTNATGLPVGTGISGLGTNVATALAVNVGTAGAFVVNGGALGTPSSGTLTNATGLPVGTGISGLGTNVATALAVNVGTAGAFVVNGGALGTPSSGTVTNLTGTASININGTVGAGTPNTGAFTTLTASADSAFNSTGALQISKGTTLEQPGSPATGMVRYNTTTNQFEGYSGSSPAWKSIGGSTLNNDTSTATALYPVFAGATSGTAENLYTSNAKLLYTPSTGDLTATQLGASNGIMFTKQTINTSVTFPTGYDGISGNNSTIASGVTVTVPSGQVWTIV
ncbi:hypothetical protein UFOVP713_11 [uncultured Caudovirales phage]|uniref:Uncharacterized protein n=1 Tax=uncultured Caudovirales phage TaxID=2100421 RepID=A0A6J5NHY0_9CAUD|nr:hypothetical protein UFOVP713_11 [uncultured Caudovirales phage]